MMNEPIKDGRIRASQPATEETNIQAFAQAHHAENLRDVAIVDPWIVIQMAGEEELNEAAFDNSQGDGN
jgi:hypothetical protein